MISVSHLVRIAAFTAFFFNGTTFAQSGDESERLARELIDKSGITEAMTGPMMQSMELLARQILPLAANADPNAAQLELTDADFARMAQIIGEEFGKRFPSLVEEMVPIYANNFTNDELRELIAFYDSPIGRKLVEKQPILSQQGAALGQAWGQRIGQEAGQEAYRRWREERGI